MDNTQRFSNRVEDYVKYRPHYPEAVISWMRDNYYFDAQWEVADVGSGTGISTELFLRNGNRVYGVEPNAAMREKAEELLAGYAGFVSMNGTAEKTGLPDGAVNLVVAGQAFHWFEPDRARAEFVRILRPGGCVALIWNERKEASSFEKEYAELILQYAGEYKTVNHKNTGTPEMEHFFSPQPYRLQQFDNEQLFDAEGLRGRLLSSSYVPKEGPVHEAMLKALADLFARHQSGGQVRVGYDTKLYMGVIRP